MNAGYVRLSRDDDKHNYVSIENQKLIIRQYAESQNISIDRWYEDDGISGYIFDRPGFHQLMNDLDTCIDTVLVKDFSRLGRHNAKVLLLLNEFQERGKHLIVIDDNYDSLQPDDDTIGIKTWYNERYVKDTSKKIRHAINALQKEGTLLTTPPFGYIRNPKQKELLEIVPKEAQSINIIYDLYLNGYGYRKIANHLTDLQIPTPSMLQHERRLEEGRYTTHLASSHWSESMVKNILNNDFYAGTLRLKKRVRTTIHGKDKRVPRSEQYEFKHHHPAIIDQLTFDRVQKTKANRIKSHYRGVRQTLPQKSQPLPLPSSNQQSPFHTQNPAIPKIFETFLFCKDCNSRLTPIVRSSTSQSHTYYICSKYNTKGKRYCPKSHLIKEPDLIQDILVYLSLCKTVLHKTLSSYPIENYTFSSPCNSSNFQTKSINNRQCEVQHSIARKKQQLKTLFSQKVSDIARFPDRESVIAKAYIELQKDILSEIQQLESTLHEITFQEHYSLEFPDQTTAFAILDKIISTKNITHQDIELLIEKITVDENGFPEIKLKSELPDWISTSPSAILNCHEHKIFAAVLELILSDHRGFTSAKYLSENLSKAGFAKSKTTILPYINLMLNMKIIEKSNNPRKPFTIIQSKDEIRKLLEHFQQLIPPKGNSET